MNVIHTISPYKYNDIWVFDDSDHHLRREAFISGADTLMDELSVRAKKPFTLFFSAQPFPSHEFTLKWHRKEHMGNWYFCPQFNLKCWFCAAMRHYFARAPKNIYLAVRK